MTKVAIVDYGSGNIRSIQFALNRLGVKGVLSDDPDLIRSAEKVIFPGVGQASYAMDNLKSRGLDKIIPTLSQPVLGICLGMQLMCLKTEERDTEGLGIFPLEVLRFPSGLNVPHMGWNALDKVDNILKNPSIERGYAYFVHSYYVPLSPYTIAQTSYGLPFSAALQKDNFYACQFHPEKSGDLGEQILFNFLEL